MLELDRARREEELDPDTLCIFSGGGHQRDGDRGAEDDYEFDDSEDLSEVLLSRSRGPIGEGGMLEFWPWVNQVSVIYAD